jgi:hypothetical protein
MRRACPLHTSSQMPAEEESDAPVLARLRSFIILVRLLTDALHEHSRYRSKINAGDFLLLQIAHRHEPPFAPTGSWYDRTRADAVSALLDGSFNMMRSLQAPGNPTEQSSCWRSATVISIMASPAGPCTHMTSYSCLCSCRSSWRRLNSRLL